MLRKKPLVALACLVGFLLLNGCEKPAQKEARYIKHGNELYEAGEYKKARIEYKNAVKINPTDAEPYFRIGVVDETEGDLRNALANYMAAEQQNAHFHPAILKIAQYYIGAEQYDEARQRIGGVLSEDAQNAEAHALMASILLQEKKYSEAEQEGQEALRTDPANVSGRIALIGIYSEMNAFDKAVAIVGDGITRNPHNLPLLLLRVMLYENAKDLSKITESYQAIFKLKPDEVQFRVDLASYLVKEGKLDEAEASLRQGIEAMPAHMELRHQFVMFLGEHRGLEAAEHEIKELMRANPQTTICMFGWPISMQARTRRIKRSSY